MSGWLFLFTVAAVAVAVFLIWTRFWYLGPCPACRGRKGRGLGSTSGAFSRCRRCGGSGERVRPLARIWPQHRAAARQLKARRSQR